MGFIFMAAYVAVAVLVTGTNADVNSKTLTKNMQEYHAQKGGIDYQGFNR